MNPRRGVLRQYIVVQELSSVTLTQVTGIWKPTDSGFHSLLARDKAETTATNAVRKEPWLTAAGYHSLYKRFHHFNS